MAESRKKRVAHVQNPGPSEGWYAEVKDLIKRVDPENGICRHEIGIRGWRVRLGGREAEVPDYAFECLYKDKPAYETSEGYVTYDLHEEAIYRLVGLIETHSV